MKWQKNNTYISVYNDITEIGCSDADNNIHLGYILYSLFLRYIAR